MYNRREANEFASCCLSGVCFLSSCRLLSLHVVAMTGLYSAYGESTLLFAAIGMACLTFAFFLGVCGTCVPMAYYGTVPRPWLLRLLAFLLFATASCALLAIAAPTSFGVLPVFWGYLFGGTIWMVVCPIIVALLSPNVYTVFSAHIGKYIAVDSDSKSKSPSTRSPSPLAEPSGTHLSRLVDDDEPLSTSLLIHVHRSEEKSRGVEPLPKLSLDVRKINASGNASSRSESGFMIPVLHSIQNEMDNGSSNGSGKEADGLSSSGSGTQQEAKVTKSGAVLRQTEPVQRRNSYAPSKPSPDRAHSAESADAPPYAELKNGCETVFPFCSGRVRRFVIADIINRPWVHASVTLLMLSITFAVFLVTHDMCVCSQPQEFSTWATRRSAHRYCQEGQACWSYVTLGGNCSTLMLVVQSVLPTDVSVLQVSTDVCLGTSMLDRTVGASSSNTTRGVSTFWGRVVAMEGLAEDNRYAAHVPLMDLQSNSTHVALTTLYLSNGGQIKATTKFRSIPCAAQSRVVSFVGGGDYRTGGIGKTLIDDALNRQPNASFIFIAGDLAYANNMRTCYLRWDEFFDEVLQVARTRDNHKALLPLLTAVGNHEGGGYLMATTSQERQLRYAFYTAYFPYLSKTAPRLNSEYTSPTPAPPPTLVPTPVPVPPTTAGPPTTAIPPTTTAVPSPFDNLYRANKTYVQSQLEALMTRDATLTFHDHDIGGLFTIVVMDSDIMVGAAEQTRWCTEAFAAASTRTSTGVIVPIYHNPIFPSVREFTDDGNAGSRQHFLPIIEQYRFHIPVALEHHDHVYKRTHMIYDNAIVNRTVDPTKRGTVYIGDGSLGVFDYRTLHHDRWYLDRTAELNYVLRLSVWPNATVEFTATGERFNATAQAVVVDGGSFNNN